MISYVLEKLRAVWLFIVNRYIVERKTILGGELAAAQFIVAMNGKVKLFGDDHWYSRAASPTKSLPKEKTPDLVVEAADLSKTQLIYEGLENLCELIYNFCNVRMLQAMVC